mgnify:CR=1 FL=1
MEHGTSHIRFGALIIGDEILSGKRQDKHMAKLIDLMNECQAHFPKAKVFSLPRMEPDRHIELGVRGDPGEVTSAIAKLKRGVSALGFHWAEAQ